MAAIACFLVAAVPVAEVREGRGDGVDHRHDLEGDQEQRARQQVLHRDRPRRQVDVEASAVTSTRIASPSQFSASISGIAAQTATAATRARPTILTSRPERASWSRQRSRPNRGRLPPGRWCSRSRESRRSSLGGRTGRDRGVAPPDPTSASYWIAALDGLARGLDRARRVGPSDDGGLGLAQRVPDRRHLGDARHDLPVLRPGRGDRRHERVVALDLAQRLGVGRDVLRRLEQLRADVGTRPVVGDELLRQRLVLAAARDVRRVDGDERRGRVRALEAGDRGDVVVDLAVGQGGQLPRALDQERRLPGGEQGDRVVAC